MTEMIVVLRVTRTVFEKGTRILTITGERAIKYLAIGDLLPTDFDGIRRI